MAGYGLLILVAVAGGIAVVFQSQFVGLLDQGLGSIESVFVTYVGGAILIGLIMLALRGGNLGAWQSVPWYALTAGVMGLVIIGTLSYSVPRLGLVAAFTIIVATQFIGGALIDHFGLFGAAVRPLDWSRVMGILVLLTGVWLIIRQT